MLNLWLSSSFCFKSCYNHHPQKHTLVSPQPFNLLDSLSVKQPWWLRFKRHKNMVEIPLKCPDWFCCREETENWKEPLSFASRYKKNIKALYIVHPTMFIKTLLILFKPFIRSVVDWRRLLNTHGDAYEATAVSMWRPHQVIAITLFALFACFNIVLLLGFVWAARKTTPLRSVAVFRPLVLKWECGLRLSRSW